MKAAIFDFGGVIIRDTTELYLQEFARIFKTSKDEILDAIGEILHDYQIGKITDNQAKTFFTRRFGPADKEMHELWLHGYESAGFFDENIRLIRELKKEGVKVACLSNTLKCFADHNRKQGNYEIFDEVILSNEVGMRKPQPEIYKFALKKLKVSPVEAVFIDDKKRFVDAAVELGMHGIVFVDEAKLQESIRELFRRTGS